MGKELVAIPQSRHYDGRAMAALTDRRRDFVVAMLKQGVNPKAAGVAAAQCGYHANYGYELMRDEGILAALREESTKRLAGAALVGVNVMLEIANNPSHKDQYRAAKDLAAINGFTAEQRIVVEHISHDSKAQIEQIKDMATQLGLDPKQLIQSAGIVEAEYSEVEAAPSSGGVDDSDW